MKSVYKIFTLGLLALINSSQITAAVPPMTQLRNILNTPVSITNLQPIYNLLQNPPRNGYGNLPNLFTEKYGIASTSLNPALIAQVQAVNTAWTAYKARNSTATQEALINAVDQIGVTSARSGLLKSVFGAPLLADYTAASGALNTLNTTTRAANTEVMDAKNYLLGLIGRRGNMALVTPLDQKMEAIFAAQLRTVVPAATVDPIKPLIKARPTAALPTTALVAPVPPTVGASYLDTYNQAQPVVDRLVNTITDTNNLLDTTATGLTPAVAFPANSNLQGKAQALITDLNGRIAAAITGGGVHGATLTGIDTYLTDLPKNPTSFAANVTDPAIAAIITRLIPGGLAMGQAGIRDILASPSLGLAGAVGGAGTTDAKVQAVVEALVMELWKTFHELTKVNGYPSTAASAGISVIAQQEITRLNALAVAGGGVLGAETDPRFQTLRTTITTLSGALTPCNAAAMTTGATDVNITALDAAVTQMKDALVALSAGVPAGLPAANGAALATAITNHIRGGVAPAIPATLYTAMADPTISTINNGTALGNLAALNINTIGIINVTDLTLAPGYTPAQFETAAKKAFASLWLLLDGIDAANKRTLGKDIQEDLEGHMVAARTNINCNILQLTTSASLVVGRLEAAIAQARTDIAAKDAQIAAKDAQITTLTGDVTRLTAQLATARAGGGAGPAVDPVTAHNAQVEALATQIANIWPGFNGKNMVGPINKNEIELAPGQLNISVYPNYFDMASATTPVALTALGTRLRVNNAGIAPGDLTGNTPAGPIRAMLFVQLPWAEIARLQAQALVLPAGSHPLTFQIANADAPSTAPRVPAPTVVNRTFTLKVVTLP